jgi:hypothetical protein
MLEHVDSKAEQVMKLFKKAISKTDGTIPNTIILYRFIAIRLNLFITLL